MTVHSVLAALTALVLTFPPPAAAQTTPAEHLGRPLGRDFESGGLARGLELFLEARGAEFECPN